MCRAKAQKLTLIIIMVIIIDVCIPSIIKFNILLLMGYVKIMCIINDKYGTGIVYREIFYHKKYFRHEIFVIYGIH